MGKGKKKIDIEPIPDYQTRMVTFSKRREGLFKKARKLEHMFGASISIAVISETGRPYLHGSPSLLERALASTTTATSSSTVTSSSTTTSEADFNSSTTTVAIGTIEERIKDFKASVNSKLESRTSPEKAESLKRELRRVDEKLCENE